MAPIIFHKKSIPNYPMNRKILGVNNFMLPYKAIILHPKANIKVFRAYTWIFEKIVQFLQKNN